MSSVARAALNNSGRRRAVLLLLALLFFGLLAFDRAGWLLARNVDDLGTYHGRTVRVINVLSGDLLEVDLPDALHERPTTQVKLWGISAPQPPRPGRDGEDYWEESISTAASHALGRELLLTLEPSRTRDPQGRLLAHVELPTGYTLNETLLEEGMALRHEKWPHAMLKAYAQSENRARRNGNGLWKSEPLRPRGG